MSDYVALIENFYAGFQAGEAGVMAASYHPDATFEDPVFKLRGDEIGDMWRMFCAGDNDVEVEYSGINVVGEEGSAHWEARYVFGPKRRPVHNRIDATFKFTEGLIIHHRDDFDLAAWSRQALGLPGKLLGSTAWLQTRVRDQAAHQLKRFRTSPD
ncbi:MAG TPA: nuclear transport factor 2 family protein [Acidimicrobiia bacterium]